LQDGDAAIIQKKQAITQQKTKNKQKNQKRLVYWVVGFGDIV
jgi:hypothetical protein